MSTPCSSHWLRREVQEVADVILSNVDKKTRPSETPVLLCNYTDVLYNDYIHSRIEFMRASASGREIEKFSLHEGDVIITKDSETREDIAETVAVVERLDGVLCGYHLAILRPKQDRVDGRFLAAALKADSTHSQLAAAANGITRFGLTMSALRKVKVCLPPLPEQRKIAEILTTWDEALALLDRRIELARERKKGLMQRLLTGRVRFPEFAGEPWEEHKLGTVVERVTRKNTTGCDTVLTMSGELGLVSQTEYYSKRIASRDTSHYYLLRRGEFAYNKSTSQGYPFGAIKRLDDYDEGVLSTLYICFRLRDPERFSSDFLAHYFEGGRLNKGIYAIAQEGARNHGLLNISVSDFFGLRLELPSLPEQRRIAGVLETCDEEIALLERKRELTAQQKTGLMQRLLTGRVRV